MKVGKAARFDVFFEVAEMRDGSTLLNVNGWKKETAELYCLEFQNECQRVGVEYDRMGHSWPVKGQGFVTYRVYAACPNVFDICARVKFGDAWIPNREFYESPF